MTNHDDSSRTIRARDFRADRAWGALDVAKIEGATALVYE